MEVDPAIAKEENQVESTQVAGSKRLVVLTLIGLSAVFLVSVLLRPSSGDYFTICGFKNFTALPCPGCGLTHSFCALGSGHLRDAFAFNLMGPPLFLVFVFVWIRSAGVLLNKGSLVEALDHAAKRFNVVRALAIAFALYGVVRIIYVVAYGQVQFQNSALSQLIAKIIH